MLNYVPNETVTSYSDAVVVPTGTGEMAFVAGQLGISFDETKNVETIDFAEEARRCLEALKSVLSKAGMEMAHIIRTDTYLSDLDDYPDFAKVRSGFFGANPPASTLVQAELLKGARIEICAVAFKPAS